MHISMVPPNLPPFITFFHKDMVKSGTIHHNFSQRYGLICHHTSDSPSRYDNFKDFRACFSHSMLTVKVNGRTLGIEKKHLRFLTNYDLNQPQTYMTNIYLVSQNAQNTADVLKLYNFLFNGIFLVVSKCRTLIRYCGLSKI